MLYDEGWSYKKIAHALFITHEAVRQHTLDYEADRKLVPENGGSSSKLNPVCRDMLIHHLKENIYTSAREIASLVQNLFEIKYTPAGMTAWLKSNGFSYKKPMLVPGKADPLSQEQWLEYYRKLKAGLSHTEAIYFMDGVHPTHNTKPSHGWIKTGMYRALKTNSARRRLHISGAIDIESKCLISQEDQTLNADSTICFLKKLEHAYPEKKALYLFCDNAGYYRNRKVQDFLKTSKISMQFLPPYSPNLNPIERLWKLMNEQILNNRYYEKFGDFKDRILGFLKKLANPLNSYSDLLKRRITDNFRVIKPPPFVNSSA